MVIAIVFLFFLEVHGVKGVIVSLEVIDSCFAKTSLVFYFFNFDNFFNF